MIVKVCGITTVADAALAREAGADIIGLNLVAGPRQISLEAAKTIAASLDDPACAVALLRVNDDAAWVSATEALAGVGAGLVQLYGGVDELVMEKVRGLGLRSIWVYHVPADGDLDELPASLATLGPVPPDFLLLDVSDPARLGGTGKTLDWAALATSLGTCGAVLPPILLAGGLTQANVATAIAQVSPVGVDVSSGVEASPGKKSPSKIRAFIKAAR